MNLTETEKRMYGTMFVLFIVSMAFGTGFVTLDKIMNLVSGNGYVGSIVVPPTVDQPFGLIEKGDTLSRTLSVTPTTNAQASSTVNTKTLLYKTITVYKVTGGVLEQNPRTKQSISISSVSTSTPETMSISYTVPATEADGTFFVTMLLSKNTYALTDVANNVWTMTGSEQLGTASEAYSLGSAPVIDPTQYVLAIIRQIITSFCASNPTYCD